MSKISELSDGGALQSTDYLIAVRSGGNVKVQLSELPSGIGAGGNIVFGDNEKAIFGAGSDLQIYHDGSNSYIQDEGTGGLIISSNGAAVYIQKGLTETSAEFNTDGAVKLRYDNVTKFETTATGIDVTGTVTADGLTVETAGTTGGTITTADYGVFDLTNGTSTVRLQNNNSIPRIGSATNHPFVLASNEVQRIKLETNGDISFYNSAGSSQSLFWDASAEALGIGTSSPSLFFGDSYLVVGDGTGTPTSTIYGSSTGTSYMLFADGTTGSEPYRGGLEYNHASDYLGVFASGAERMRLDASGNLLVGKTSDNNAVAGTTISNSGIVKATRTDWSLLLNRLTTDGDIALFQKDGTTVGSVGTANSNTYYSFNSTKAITTDGASDIVPCTSGGVKQVGGYMSLGSSSYPFNNLYLSGGVKVGTSGRTTYTAGGFYDNAASGNNIGVVTGGNHVFLSDGNGTATDNVNDLGSTSRRIRDIYVGGGVYLGGTGAANLLDDYEEGTWTPAAAAYAGVMTVNSATYEKIGRQVTLRANLTFDGTADGSAFQLVGLPFSQTVSEGAIGASSGSAEVTTFYATASTTIRSRKYDGSSVSYTNMGAATIELTYVYSTAS